MVACGHSESAPEAKTTVSNLALGEPQSEEDGGCYFVQPKFFRKGLSIYTCDRKEAKGDPQDRDVLRMEKAYSMLQRIPDCDVKYFGLNPRLVRPEHLMITVSVLQTTRGSYRFPFSAVCFFADHVLLSQFLLQVLPVPPPHVRPIVSFSALSKGDDDLTYKYANIVRANNELAHSVSKFHAGASFGCLSVPGATVGLTAER
jgi:hypothetical protein